MRIGPDGWKEVKRCMNENLAILFCRSPELGKVKKRLAIEIGKEKALKVYKILLDSVIGEMDNPEFHPIVFLKGDRKKFEKHNPKSFDIASQDDGDLGERMHKSFQKGFEQGAENVILFGSDILDLRVDDFKAAFSKLDSFDLVLGPAFDGGYYLIGMKQPQPGLFEGIDWGTEGVLNQTLKKAGELDLNVYLLARKKDIDGLNDLQGSPEFEEILVQKS